MFATSLLGSGELLLEPRTTSKQCNEIKVYFPKVEFAMVLDENKHYHLVSLIVIY